MKKVIRKPTCSHTGVSPAPPLVKGTNVAKLYGALINTGYRVQRCEVCKCLLIPDGLIQLVDLYGKQFSDLSFHEFVDKAVDISTLPSRPVAGGMTSAVESHSSTHTPTQGRKR